MLVVWFPVDLHFTCMCKGVKFCSASQGAENANMTS